MLDNTPNQSYKFRTKNSVEVYDDSRGTYCDDSQIEFKIPTLSSILCDYSDAYVLVKGIVAIPNTATASAAPNNRQKK